MPRSVSARESYLQNVCYIAKAVAYNTTGISAAGTFLVGVIPAGSMITAHTTVITEVFNAATTNVLTLGTAADDDMFVAAADITEGTLGRYTAMTGVGPFVVTADTPVYARYTQTGTAATTGAAYVSLNFIRISDP